MEIDPFSRETVTFSLSGAGVVLREQECIITQLRRPVRLKFIPFTEFPPFSFFFPFLFFLCKSRRVSRALRTAAN